MIEGTDRTLTRSVIPALSQARSFRKALTFVDVFARLWHR